MRTCFYTYGIHIYIPHDIISRIDLIAIGDRLGGGLGELQLIAYLIYVGRDR
jgi:hypothetical protein